MFVCLFYHIFTTFFFNSYISKYDTTGCVSTGLYQRDLFITGCIASYDQSTNTHYGRYTSCNSTGIIVNVYKSLTCDPSQGTYTPIQFSPILPTGANPLLCQNSGSTSFNFVCFTNAPPLVSDFPSSAPVVSPTASSAPVVSKSPSSGSSSSSSSSSSSCFSADATVQLVNGAIKLLSTVEVGDLILTQDATGISSYAPVVAVPHAMNNDIQAQFVDIQTVTGKSVRVTPDHLLMANKAAEDKATSRLHLASSLKAGDFVTTVSGPEEILSITALTGRGIYTAVTTNEYVVVNDFVASPFGTNHKVAHAFYSVHRVLYRLFPSAMKCGAASIAPVMEAFGALMTKMVQM